MQHKIKVVLVIIFGFAYYISINQSVASEVTCIVSGGALNSTHSLSQS